MLPLHRSFSNCFHGGERNITLFADDGSFSGKKTRRILPVGKFFQPSWRMSQSKSCIYETKADLGRGRKDLNQEKERIKMARIEGSIFIAFFFLLPFTRRNYDRKTNSFFLFPFRERIFGRILGEVWKGLIQRSLEHSLRYRHGKIKFNVEIRRDIFSV